MDNPKPIESSGAFGIPKWVMKKGMRYEVDDFIVSPPSNEDDGFMRLRFGRCPSPRRQLSPLDGAGAELGMTVEVRESSSLISGMQGSDSSNSLHKFPTISFGPGVLSTETTPTATPFTSPGPVLDSPHASPLHMLTTSPILDTKTATKDEMPNSENSIKSPVEFVQPSRSTSAVIVETFRKISSTTRPTFENFLLDGAIKESIQSQSDSPNITPKSTPKSSPLLQRRVMGVAMENPNMNMRKLSAHSYFCTKPFQPQQDASELQDAQHSLIMISETQQDSSGSTREGDIGASNLSATARTQQLDEAARTLESLNVAGKFMGKRRARPKPSALREMNFWAPTSM